ncbi:MAG TPA: ankyrin repeat domain-containing protein [Planctomycetota bacterium]|nr:ankyrin repeat domain-containing protein [Planctomycetota bacterium]
MNGLRIPVLILMAAAALGCGGGAGRYDFIPARAGSFDARPHTAAVLTKSVRDLLQEGFVRIGELSITLEVTETSGDATSTLLRRAADHGGDGVFLTESNRTGSAQRAVYSYRSDTRSMESWERQMTGLPYRTVTTAELVGYRKVGTLTSRGSVWRKDPDLARKDLAGLTLAVAAMQGNLAELDRQLQAGGDPNFSVYGLPPLQAAALMGRDDALRRLLAAGADPERPDALGRKAWHEAAKNGHPTTARLLLGSSPLLPAVAAIEAGDADALRKLCLEKSKPVTIPEDERILSVLAWKSSNSELLRILIENKGVGRHPLSGGQYADYLLLMAVMESNHELIQRLLDLKVWPNYPSVERNLGAWAKAPTLHYAAMAGDARSVRMLLHADAYRSIEEKIHGYTPIHWAVLSGDVETTVALLAAGSEPGERAYDSRLFGVDTTPLRMSLLQDQLAASMLEPKLSDLSRLLLDLRPASTYALMILQESFNVHESNYGATPDPAWKLARAKDWNARARQASAQGRKDFANDLYRVAARVRYDPEPAAERLALLKEISRTPLVEAALRRWPEEVKLLLLEKHDPQEKGELGLTALQIASDQPRLDVIRAFLEAGLIPRSHVIAPEPKGSFFRLIAGCGPLHAAAYEGDAALVRDLAKAGAPLEGRTKNSQTALMLAAYRGKTECVRELVEAGADVNARLTESADHWPKGSCVLEFALCTYRDYDSREALRFLLAHGATPNVHANDGKPLLTWAGKHLKGENELGVGVTKERYALLESAINRK